MEAAKTNNKTKKATPSAELTTWKLIKMLINCSFVFLFPQQNKKNKKNTDEFIGMVADGLLYRCLVK